MLTIIITILLGIVILGASGIYYLKSNGNLILKFIKNNPNKTTIKLVRNDRLLAEKNPNKMMPLASTVKIILAIEYAEQSSKGIINPNQKVALDEIAKFYVPNTDGGAHSSWLKSVKDKIVNNAITIREIAKGMILYSSNANTEWLCEKLGLDNINKQIDSLGITEHTEIYYIVSALFLGTEKFPTLKDKELENKLKALSIDDYIEVTNQIHHKLSVDATYKKSIGYLGMETQRIWSNNLPGSTVNEYVEIMKKINSRTYFSLKTHQYLDEVMEFLLDNPANRKWLKHVGMKGGSTAFVLTNALYATDKTGNKTELAYFFNDLGVLQRIRLERSMNAFELKILTDEAFRNKIERELKN